MPNEVDESSPAAKRKEVQREALLNSPVHVAPLRTSAKDLPPYGAQHRQDALWKGGNETLPPLWHQFKVLDDNQYQDNKLTMVSHNRPLPGVRLDDPGDLVAPRYEWHISPLGRSYFVDHNTQTTSWKKPKPERSAGSLMPECIIEGHSQCIWSLTFLGTNDNIMSTSQDSSIRQWKRNGEPVGKPWHSDRGVIGPIAVSPDETMVVGGSIDGSLQLWNIKEGSMVGDPWEGHDDVVRCLDWSRNALEIASGSEDGTVRRWNPDTGRQLAPPTETSHSWVIAVKYSPQGDKFMSGGADGVIRVWSKDSNLLVEIKGHDRGPGVTSLRWSNDGAHIFSGSGDHTIRKWRLIDGQELVVFRGHTNPVKSLCLTPNESYIVSASNDCSIRIWDLKTNQAVGDPLWHDDRVVAVALSPDGKYIASAGPDKKIYIWSLEAALKVVDAYDDNAKLKGRPARPRDVRQPIAKTRGSARYGNDFFGDESDSVTRRAAQRAGPLSLIRWRRLFGSLQFGARLTDAPRPSPRESRHWNFSLHPRGNSSRTVDVAPARDEDRYGIVPETDAEAAAAMQRTNSNQANSSTQQGQLAAEAEGSQARPTGTQQSTVRTGEVSYEVTCCGFFFGRRSTSRQS